MSKIITIEGLIKVAKSEHIDQLQKEGVIYCNTVKFFRETNSKDKERRDDREGATCSVCGKNLKLFIDGGNPLPVNFTKSILNMYKEDVDQTHLFCLYAITPNFVNGVPFVDQKNLDFGNTALLITNPLEFINRIKRATANAVSYDLIDYYDESIDHNNLTVFHKPDKFKHQNEFRFHFKDGVGDVFKFTIGSIEDISQVLDSSVLTSLYLQRIKIN